jgi:hypothetical protein
MASDKKLSALTSLGGAPNAADYIYIVDVSEPLDADKSKRLLISDLFTSPILVTPFIGDFTNANHDHTNASEGGVITTNLITYENDIIVKDGDVVFKSI